MSPGRGGITVAHGVSRGGSIVPGAISPGRGDTVLSPLPGLPRLMWLSHPTARAVGYRDAAAPRLKPIMAGESRIAVRQNVVRLPFFIEREVNLPLLDFH